MALTAARVRELLNYDASTGVFTWRAAAGRWGRIHAGAVAGRRMIWLDGKQYLSSRLACLYVHGNWPAKYEGPLTAARLREILSYDRLIGVFVWLVKPNEGRGSVRIGDVAGTLCEDGYRRIGIDGNTYPEHRLAWLYDAGAFPPDEMDHKDTIRDHNWIANLRPATYAQNAQNKNKASARSKSGLLGAFKRAGRHRWFSTITVDGKQTNLGTFSTAEAAHAAYMAAKVNLHPFHYRVEAI